MLDQILDYFPPREIEPGNTQMLITSLDFSTYVGRIAIGRLHRGDLKENQPIILAKRDGTHEKHRVKELFVFDGTERRKVESVVAGDICAVTGIEGFEIGDCICDAEAPDALKTITIDEPTMNMLFSINDSPFFGKEGKKVTSRHIQERLTKELEKNLAMRVSDTDKADKWDRCRSWCIALVGIDRDHASRRIRIASRSASGDFERNRWCEMRTN